MADYKTPGVYVEEISTLPPSVGQVPTAIPAFIGYTAKAVKNRKDLTFVPTHITSLLEYRELFGAEAKPGEITVTLDDQNGVKGVDFQVKRYLYDSVRLFYANGGGECYVVSVGDYFTNPSMDDLQKGLDALYAEDHPTLLVMPDAMLLEKSGDCYALQQAMLKQCADMQDRFSILDVHEGFYARNDKDVVINFRNGIGINHLNYGAAYYPWVQTVYTPNFGYGDVKLVRSSDPKTALKLKELIDNPTPVVQLEQIMADEKNVHAASEAYFQDAAKTSINQRYAAFKPEDRETPKELQQYADTVKDLVLWVFNLSAGKLKADPTKAENPTFSLQSEDMIRQAKSKVAMGTPLSTHTRSLEALNMALGLTSIKGVAEFKAFQLDNVVEAPGVKEAGEAPAPAPEGEGKEGGKEGGKGKAPSGGGAINYPAARNKFKALLDAVVSVLESVKVDVTKIRNNHDKNLYDNESLYKSIVNEIQIAGGKLPPSGGIAGLYAQVDNQLGVWKAPANVSLASTNRPWIKVDDNGQRDLNVDVNAGKSINCIRSFAGKGTLVWGARTLAGNDNEWRYVSVRRTFIMIEQSIKASTFWAVFEANESRTWVKVKAMITNYLTNLWRQGALAGSTPEQAFFVNLGLGQTMTAVDILEGRMNVEIGLAVVRPAEFIILKFSHKMQES